METLSQFTHDQLTQARALDFSRMISCLHECEGAPMLAAKTFLTKWPRAFSVDAVKAAIAAGGTTDASWAAPLALKPLADGFLAYAAPLSVLGRIPNLRRVPFNIAVAVQTSAGAFRWIGPGAPKSVTNFAFSALTLGTSKASGIIVLTAELLRAATPAAGIALRESMAHELAKFLDGQLVDPAVAEVVNVSPGSITNGIVAIPSSGPSIENGRTDITALVAALEANVEAPVLLMSPRNAVALSSIYPDLRWDGGFASGMPTITSRELGDRVIIADARALLVADDGGIEFDMSTHADVQMDSAPSNPGTGATVLTSLWQQDLVGLRVERWITWRRARLGAVAFVTGANYGAAA